jgi:hypothetical protein
MAFDLFTNGYEDIGSVAGLFLLDSLVRWEAS